MGLQVCPGLELIRACAKVASIERPIFKRCYGTHRPSVGFSGCLGLLHDVLVFFFWMGQRDGDIADRLMMFYLYMKYPGTTYSVRDSHGCFPRFLDFNLTLDLAFRFVLALVLALTFLTFSFIDTWLKGKGNRGYRIVKQAKLMPTLA